jgi:hypothetical protein
MDVSCCGEAPTEAAVGAMRRGDPEYQLSNDATNTGDYWRNECRLEYTLMYSSC